MKQEHKNNYYLRRLLLLLVSAAFFQGYDSSILALLLPNIQDTFQVSEAVLGIMRGPIELGLFAAFFVARLADRYGRRPLLLWSVIGYTAFTVLTALSWDIWSFALFQFGSRIFLGAEFAVSVTMIVEEFPADRRGRALGTLLAFDALGTVAVALLLGAGVQNGPLGWRTFFLVGVLPLVVLSLYRRRLRETRRFVESHRVRERVGLPSKSRFFEPWQSRYRKNLIVVGMVHLLRSVPLFGATAWWAFFAQRERGFSEAEVAIYILTAYSLGCLGYYLCGRLMEWIGYRPTAVLYLGGGGAAGIVLFQANGKALSFFALLLAVAFGLGAAPVLSAFASELFPTEIRGQAAAWVHNWFEIPGYIFGPLLVGVLGDHTTGVIGNIGDSITLLTPLVAPAAYLVWRYLPETSGRDLDEIHGPPETQSEGRPAARRG